MTKIWVLILWVNLSNQPVTVEQCYSEPGLCEGKEFRIMETQKECLDYAYKHLKNKMYACEFRYYEFAR